MLIVMMMLHRGFTDGRALRLNLPVKLPGVRICNPGPTALSLSSPSLSPSPPPAPLSLQGFEFILFFVTRGRRVFRRAGGSCAGTPLGAGRRSHKAAGG